MLTIRNDEQVNALRELLIASSNSERITDHETHLPKGTIIPPLVAVDLSYLGIILDDCRKEVSRGGVVQIATTPDDVRKLFRKQLLWADTLEVSFLGARVSVHDRGMRELLRDDVRVRVYIHESLFPAEMPGMKRAVWSNYRVGPPHHKSAPTDEQTAAGVGEREAAAMATGILESDPRTEPTEEAVSAVWDELLNPDLDPEIGVPAKTVKWVDENRLYAASFGKALWAGLSWRRDG